MHQRYRRKRAAFILALFAGVVAAVWSYLPAGDVFERLELRTIDARFLARGPRAPSGQVVIVEVDEESLDRIGGWQWPRQTFGELVRRLDAAGARAIGMDIVFAEPDEAQGGEVSDAVFAHDVRKSGKVFQALGGLHQEPGLTQAPADAERFAWSSAQTRPGTGLSTGAVLQEVSDAAGPYKDLAEASAGAGFVDVVPSLDGIYRQVFPVVKMQGQVYPSLSLALAALALGVRPKDVLVTAGDSIRLGNMRRVPLQRDGTMLIDYAGPSRTFNYYSAADVLEAPERIPQGAFRDKIVLVAVTALGLYDLRACPFGAVFNGVEVQANALDNILTGHFVQRLGPEWAALMALLWALVVGLCLTVVSPPLWVPATVLCLIAHNLGATWVFAHGGLLVDMVVPSVGIALALVMVPAYQLVAEEEQRRGWQDTLSRFVPRELADNLMEDAEAPAVQGEMRPVTVLFADLRGFTAASANIGAAETVELLNRYFRLMHEVIEQFGGTLDKFVGDGLMALFNAPQEQIDHAALAVATALEMQRQVEMRKDEWEFYHMPELRVSIGISTGDAVVGYVGSGERMQYTAIGAHVNLASRLEELAKDLDVKIAISPATHALVKDVVDCAELGAFELHNVPAPVKVYEVRGYRAG